VKLKLTGFVVGGVELTKRQYLHPYTASTSTSSKAKAITTNSTATTITTATKDKGIKVKILGYLATVLN